MNFARKINCKIQLKILSTVAAISKKIGKLYGIDELTLAGMILDDQKVHSAVWDIAEHAAFFPFSLLPENFKANRKRIQQLADEIEMAGVRQMHNLNKIPNTWSFRTKNPGMVH